MATATATENVIIQPPILLYLQPDQLIEDENIRAESEYEISDDFKAKLTIGGVFQNIQALIAYNEPDEDGTPCYILTDGYRRLRAANEMKKSGITVPYLKVEIWQREEAIAISKDPMLRIEYQYKLGTSSKQLGAMDAANGQKEWIDIHYETKAYPAALTAKIKQLKEKGLTEESAIAQAPSELVESKIYKKSKTACSISLGVPNNTIDKNLRVALLPETAPELLDLVESGDINNIYDAEDLRAFYSKNVSNVKFPDVSIQRFIELCKAERDLRNPDGVIRKEDGTKVLQNLNQTFAQAETNAKIAAIENEKLKEALEAGTVSSDVATKLLDHSQKTGTQVDDLLSNALAIAESDQESDESNGEPIILDDSAVNLALMESKREIAANNKTENSTAELSDQDLQLEIQRELISLVLLVCGDDLESSFEAIRNKLANYQENKGIFISESDRDFKTEIYGIVSASTAKVEKSATKLVKRISLAASVAAKAAAKELEAAAKELEAADAKAAMDAAAAASRSSLAAE